MWFTSRVMFFSDFYFTGFEFGIFVNKAQNEPHGTLFQLVTWHNHKIHPSKIKKKLLARKNPPKGLV